MPGTFGLSPDFAELLADRLDPAKPADDGARVPLTEEIVAQHERLRGSGVSIPDACREVGHSVGTFYNWKKRAEAGEGGIFEQFAERVLYAGRKTGSLRPQVSEAQWRDVDYFRAWVAGDVPGSKPLILDSGKPFEPEDWELDPVADLLSGDFRAVWLVVPEANGKTSLTAAVVLYLLEYQASAEIPIGSASVTQADTLYRSIEGFVIRSERLRDFNLVPGLRRIDCRLTGGHTRVYPHNVRSGDGVIPSASALDEAHLHPNLRLYRVWKGKWGKREGPVIAISTAGELGSEFEDLRAKLLREGEHTRTAGAKGQYVRAVHGDTVLHDWAVRDAEDATNFQVVAEANPLSSITAAELEAKHAEPEMTDEHWLRRTCNVATRPSGEGIGAAEWDALIEPELAADLDAWTVGWIDLGWKIDTTAFGLLQWVSNERRLVLKVTVLEPPVSESDIVDGLVDLQRRFKPIGWVYDPAAGGQQMAQLLEAGEHPRQEGQDFSFIEHSQANQPMSIAASRLDEAIRNGWLVHDGNSTLRTHVLNAVKRQTGAERYRYDRPEDAKGERRRKYPVDALTGLLMGHSVAVAEHQKEPPKEPLIAVMRR